MYCPAHFIEDRPEVLARLIQQHPLATIIAHTSSGLVADHVPLMYVEAAGTAGRLIGHVARSNPLWRYPEAQELLIVFQGPASYVSPAWYATKAETGKVVPTWNYAVVHAHACLRAHEDPLWIRQLLESLTDRHEAGRAQPWKVSDAPAEFTEALIGNIVGIELVITRMQGKWKVSQNQPGRNQQTLVQGLLAEGSDNALSMAALVRAYGSK